VKYPWFYYSSGTGFYFTDKRWIDNMDIPFSFISDYVAKLVRGEEIEIPTERVKEGAGGARCAVQGASRTLLM